MTNVTENRKINEVNYPTGNTHKQLFCIKKIIYNILFISNN